MNNESMLEAKRKLVEKYKCNLRTETATRVRWLFNIYLWLITVDEVISQY